MLATIALRNLFRNRRRTLFSLLVAGIGTTALLLTAGFVRYSFHGLRDALIDGGLGHLEVAPTATLDGAYSVAERAGTPPGFDDWQKVRDGIEARPDVRAAAGVLQFSGVTIHGDRTTAFIGLAVEPDRERLMGTRVRIRSGENLSPTEPQAGGDQVLLGVGLGRSLGVTSGDIVTAMTATPDGSLNAIDLTVIGLFSTGLHDVDARILKTHVTTAQRLLGTDRVTAVIVGLRHTSETQKVAADLRQTVSAGGAQLSVSDWEARAPFYGQVRGLYTGIFAFLGTIVAVLVTLSTSNTLLMSVMERIREFGTLLAIGTRRAQVGQLLMLEALWLALFGGLSGSVLALAISALIAVAGIQMPPPPGAVDPLDLAVTVLPTDFAWAMVFIALVLAVAALPAIFRVYRLQIVEALDHV